MGIGQEIRKRRIQLGMTQEELAHKMNYKSKTTINKIELGINDIPLSKVEAFALVLQTTPAELMGWTLGSCDDSTTSHDDASLNELIKIASKMKRPEIVQLISYAKYISMEKTDQD